MMKTLIEQIVEAMVVLNLDETDTIGELLIELRRRGDTE